MLLIRRANVRGGAVRRRLSVRRGATRVRRDGARSKRLSIGAKELSAWWDTTRNSRNGDKSGGTRRRDRLKDAFLIHPSTVLALATRGALIAAATNLSFAAVSTSNRGALPGSGLGQRLSGTWRSNRRVVENPRRVVGAVVTIHTAGWRRPLGRLPPVSIVSIPGIGIMGWIRTAVLIVAAVVLWRGVGGAGIGLRLQRRKIGRLLLLRRWLLGLLGRWWMLLLARRWVTVDGTRRRIPGIMRVATTLVVGVAAMLDGGESNRGCHAGWRCFRSTLGVILGRRRVL